MWGQHQAAAESYLDWWKLAGVDHGYSDDPIAALAPRSEHAEDSPAPSSVPSRVDAPTAGRREIQPASPRPLEPLPATLPAFADWWRTSPDVPGAQGLTARVAPQGEAKARLFLFTDFPEAADAAAQGLFAGDQGELVSAMLTAAGFGDAPLYVASLFASRPPGGVISRLDLTYARDVALHQFALVDPGAILIFGAPVTTTLAPESTDSSGGASASETNSLRTVNLNGRIMPLWTLPHPRLLLARPQEKVIAWRMLKALRDAEAKDR